MIFREFGEYFQLFSKSGIGPKQVPNIAIFTGSVLVSNLGRFNKIKFLGKRKLDQHWGKKTPTLQFEKAPSTDNFNLITNVLIAEAATGGVLRNFAKFTGKHLCQRLFFNKVKTDLGRVSGTDVFLGILRNF